MCGGRCEVILQRLWNFFGEFSFEMQQLLFCGVHAKQGVLFPRYDFGVNVLAFHPGLQEVARAHGRVRTPQRGVFANDSWYS